MNAAPRAPDYRPHILEAIARIEEYTGDLDAVGFLNNRLVQDGVIRDIEVIGEACNHIRRQDPGFVATRSQVP